MRHASRVWAVVLVVLATAFAERTTVAAEFRVGPGGTHATIQAAIDAALASPGEDVIKVRTGVYVENLVINRERPLHTFLGLEISGGWDGAFASRTVDPTTLTVDPTLTVIDGGGTGHVIWAALHGTIAGGTLVLDGLSVVNGRADGSIDPPSGWGGGLSVWGPGRALIRNCQFRANQALGLTPDGGAVYATGVALSVLDSEFLENQVVQRAPSTPSGGSARGAAIAVAWGDPITEIKRSTFSRNRVSAEGLVDGSIIYVFVGPESRFEIEDNAVVDNEMTFSHPPAPRPLSAALVLHLHQREGEPSGIANLRRNHFAHNVGAPHLAVFSGLAGGTVTVSDSLFVGGSGGVESTIALGGVGTHRFTNVTLADNGGGFFARGGGTTIANSIVYRSGSGIDAAPPVTLINNLVEIDPLFVAAAAGNYHVLPGSPATDAGSDAPPAGLGPTDLDGRPRLQGAHVDIGAYETEAGGAGSRGNSCLVPGFGFIPFVPSFSQACLCIRDAGLRESRCAFFLPGLFLHSVMPVPLLPGRPVDPQWMLHAWQGAEGRYEMTVEILSAGKWVPLKGRGKQTGKLVLDKVERRTFSMLAPEADAPMRARIRHMAPGANGPVMVEDVVYMLVDVAGKGEQP